ncbi:MAG: hypothetical protein GY754_32875 [bacterium]|nr:hypothetical protein [bacterium]
MKTRIKIAKILFYITGVFCLIMAGLYLLTPGLLPYHIKFLGKAQKDLDQKMVTLMLYAVRIIGAMALSLGLVVITLTRKMIPGESWVRWLLLITLMITLSTILAVTVSVGPTAPWWLMGLMMIMSITGFFLSKK